jgi:hypothetical protein
MPVRIFKFALYYIQLIFKCQKSLEWSGPYKMENGRDSEGAYDKQGIVSRPTCSDANSEHLYTTVIHKMR